MDPRRLIIFRSVARAGSFSAGARALGWTQPAVSQHIQQLESDAGLPLFVRGHGGVELTEAGRALLRHADAVAGHLDAAQEELAEFTSSAKGTARLVSFASALAALVPPALTRLAKTHPGLDVELREAEVPDSLEVLRSGEADLALVLRYTEEAPASDLDRVELGKYPVTLVSHPSRGITETTTLKDLENDVWVAGCEHCRNHLLAITAAAGFQPQVRHTTDDYVVVQALVAQNLAVSLLPSLALDVYRNPGVEPHTLPELGTFTVELLTRPGVASVPAVAATIDALRQGSA